MIRNLIVFILLSSTLDRVIDQLNVIRAGRSLKDPENKKDLKDYFDRLNGTERTALYAFLSGLSKIMQAGEQAKQVATPNAEPYSIGMKKEKPKSQEEKPKGSDTPIVVGESANKAKELKVISGNKR